MQFRYITHVQRECHGAVILCVDDEVWCNLLDAVPYDLAHRCSWFGVQLAQFFDERLALQVRQLQNLLQTVPVLLGEQLEIVHHRPSHQFG